MPRDRAMAAMILGFFAAGWFGWAQERPPAGWGPVLAVGSAAGVAIAVGGAVLAWRHRRGGSALGSPEAGRRYGIIVGIEFAVAGLGATALAVLGRAT